MMDINGVNLGNWLVLEKWMSPGMFAGTTADDEYYLPTQLSREVYEDRIRMHRSEYITERDFLHMQSMGLNAVRIPIPYFVFGDRAPFIGCTEELDKAFNWAEKYGIKILLDLHTVPDSQNGFDNGGISGVCKWSKEPDEIAYVLTVLERLADRYGMREGLWGIEVLNEPVMEDMWKMMRVPERYPAVDPVKAEGSGPMTMEFLRGFYYDAYRSLRAHMPDDKAVVFHDAFQLTAWKDFMQGPQWKNVVLDTHCYLMAAELDGCEQSLVGYTTYIRNHYASDIREMQSFFPVICGEWCLFNSLAVGHDTEGGQTVLNGKEGLSKERVSEARKMEIYQTLAGAQLEAWKSGFGHFYWTYKMLTDTVNEEGWVGWDSWDFCRCVDHGWYPIKKKDNGEHIL